MHRRTLLTSLLAAPIAGAPVLSARQAPQQAGTARAPEYYLWRQYTLRTGSQPRRLGEFLQGAAIPALNRAGHSPIGVFEVVAGVPAPATFLLIPSPTADQLTQIEVKLRADREFMQAGAAYLDAPATDPAFVRQETSLLSAFTKVPRVEVPPATATKGPRLFELRTYESPSERGHFLKVQMFDELGEVEIFRKVGLTPVFFGRTIAGPRMPSFSYLLVHDDMAAREKSWNAFRTSPEWKTLSATPGYADAEIVSNITTIFLRPAAYSQI